MRINFKHPKYILPLILLPFLCLFFFVYHSSVSKKKAAPKEQTGINNSMADVSPDIKKKQLEDKLDAYRSSYKEGDGLSAVNILPSEKTSNPTYGNTYSDKEKYMLDSISQAMKKKYGQRDEKAADPKSSFRSASFPSGDKAMAEALQGLTNRQSGNPVSRDNPPAKEKDPMETFKMQMAYLDSMNRVNDPAYKAEKQKKEAAAKAEALKAKTVTLEVHKADASPSAFNTVMPVKNDGFIKVVIDENLTGYAGSRIRLRLLDDIVAGHFQIPKGTYLYALITGFTGQRVSLSVKSILYQDKILPVKLDVYDLDGLAGLYVPASAFRDFTKDLGTNTIQGVTIDGSGTGSVATQMMMSSVDKIFESTSSAIAGMIRKNKAKIKYNSYLYLIDNDALQNAQQKY